MLLCFSPIGTTGLVQIYTHVSPTSISLDLSVAGSLTDLAKDQHCRQHLAAKYPLLVPDIAYELRRTIDSNLVGDTTISTAGGGFEYALIWYHALGQHA